jgi:soluble lytic murein transglycosylase-like protein
MAVQLGLSVPQRPLGVRHGGDRRRGERRARPRSGPDRRRGDRRRATLRSLLFTTLTLAFPHQLHPATLREHLKTAAPNIVPQPTVSVTIDRVVAVPPWRAYNKLIREAAAKFKVDATLIRSVMQTESAFNALAVSRAGALGLMQLMPDLAEELGVEDPFDPRENIMAGARHLRRLLDRHDGDVTLALAAYNAGPAAVAKYGTVPPFRETQDYVERVTDLMDGIR